MTLTLHSPAFTTDERIPDRFARAADNLSPPLEWSGVPDGPRRLVLLVEDPDAPRCLFRHWAVHDIPPDCTRLDEGAGRPGSELKHGANDFGNPTYDGPQPPEGDPPHHYHFRLAALDTDHLDVGPRQRAESVWEAAQDHIIEEAELIGTYQR